MTARALPVATPIWARAIGHGAASLQDSETR